MFICLLAVTVFFVQVSKGDWSDRRDGDRFGGSNNDRQECGDQWRSHDQCMKSRQSDYSRSSDLSSNDRADMKAKVRVCFRNQGCSNPFISDTDAQVKQRCYMQYRDRMRTDMEKCVQQRYPDYSIPNENDAAVQNGQDMINMRNSDCRPRDKRSFAQCLLDARGNRGGGGRSSQQRQDYCSVRQDCYQQARYTQACYDRSARVREELCRCTRQAPIDIYKNVYAQCLRAASRSRPDDRQDYNLVALNAMGNSGGDRKFCSNMSDPCGGFQGRQSIGDRNRGSGRSRESGGGGRGSSAGGWSSGDGRGWSSGSSGQESSGSGAGGWSSGQNWNQGGSGSSSIDTSSSVDTSSLGTSSGSNTDFGSLLSSGGIIPDPLSIIGSSSSTSSGSSSSSSSLGNLGSILGGGFDPSQIFGSNFDLSSILSNAGTGSNSGGLLGGLTSGGIPDLSSLFGGRKK